MSTGLLFKVLRKASLHSTGSGESFDFHDELVARSCTRSPLHDPVVVDAPGGECCKVVCSWGSSHCRGGHRVGGAEELAKSGGVGPEEVGSSRRLLARSVVHRLGPRFPLLCVGEEFGGEGKVCSCHCLRVTTRRVSNIGVKRGAHGSQIGGLGCPERGEKIWLLEFF